MLRYYRVCLLLFVCFACTAGFSQEKKDSSASGEISGVAHDSVYNSVLKAASVAIYKEDSALVNYQLTNNLGEFHFHKLPVATRLRIVINYIGYTNLEKWVVIPATTPFIDLKQLNLAKSERQLEDVVVKYVPPVRMNGDTLEFNADAFKMKDDAVGEDLLNKLPGVTVWGDGKITVNGKEVTQVLVNGKPFFGDEKRVATQNIPKTAIEKIQVYKQQNDSRKEGDSLLQMNIKLKKDKSQGYFGKIGAGYGTDDHYESEFGLNYFNKSTQVGIVAASNDVNKIASDINMMMRNSTFKGVNANVEYQPNLEQRGTNQSNAAGILFQHDFIPEADYFKTNRLTGNYFLRNSTQKINSNTQVITAIGNDSFQVQQSNDQSVNKTTSQNLHLFYHKKKNGRELMATALASAYQTDYTGDRKSSITNETGRLLSTNNIYNERVAQTSNVNAFFQIGAKNGNTSRNALDKIEVKYFFNYLDNGFYGKSLSDFKSIDKPVLNKYLDRISDNNEKELSQSLFLALNDLPKVIFGPENIFGLNLRLQNELGYDIKNFNSYVQNKNILTGLYEKDNYLSTDNHSAVVDERPGVELITRFFKELPNRFYHSWEFRLNVRGQLYSQRNNSIHAFQDFSRDYQKFIPAASVRFSNRQYSHSEDTYELGFTTGVNYPILSQLYPLVDSSNQYYIHGGNAQLKEETDRKMTFNLRHSDMRGKNDFNYTLNLSAGLVNNAFTDSSSIDSIGRSVYYTVNGNTKKYLELYGQINKVLKLHNHQIQFTLLPSLSLSRSPVNVNGAWYNATFFSNTNGLIVNYKLSDWLNTSVEANLSFNNTKQQAENSQLYKNTTRSLLFSASSLLTDKLNVGSNAKFSLVTSTGTPDTRFVIWNAYASYRLLPQNNLEVKLTALDLLHQNIGIMNYSKNNTQTYTTTNVLQQYFMLTLSYFPRKFGKKQPQQDNRF